MERTANRAQHQNHKESKSNESGKRECQRGLCKDKDAKPQRQNLKGTFEHRHESLGK